MWIALLYHRYPGLNKVADEIVKKNKLDVVQDKDFQSLKGKWPLLKRYLENNPNLSFPEYEDFVNDLLNGPTAPQVYTATPAPRSYYGLTPYFKNLDPRRLIWGAGSSD